VTMKPSIRDWGVLYKSSADARKALCLTPEVSHGPSAMAEEE